MSKSYPIRSKGKPQPNYKEVDSEESISEESLTPDSVESQIAPVRELKDSQGVKAKLSLASIHSDEVNMASDDEDCHPMKFQNLMQSIPVYDGSQKQSVRDFLDSVENVAELGTWTDEQKVRVARCRMNGIAAKFARSELIKAIKTFQAFRVALEKRFDYLHPTTQLRNFTMSNQDMKEHPRDFANRLQLLADLYFAEIFSQAVTPEEKTAAQVLHDAQLLAQYLTGLRDPVGGRVMSRDPKTFTDAIDIAVQETENEKLKEQKAGLIHASNDEDVLKKIELETMLHRLTELEVLVRQQADTIHQSNPDKFNRNNKIN